MKFKFLCIYRHDAIKNPAYGWKIFDSLEAIEELKEYYRQQKTISLYVSDFLTIRYDSYDELMGDCEFVPITSERASVIASAFDTNVFGIFPL